jgi:hypothetical protein
MAGNETARIRKTNAVYPVNDTAVDAQAIFERGCRSGQSGLERA